MNYLKIEEKVNNLKAKTDIYENYQLLLFIKTMKLSDFIDHGILKFNCKGEQFNILYLDWINTFFYFIIILNL